MNLKQTIFSAGRWTATSAMLVAGLQFLQTIVLARLLLPVEFGLMAVAAAVLAILALIADLGLSRALIHFDSVSQDALSSLYWLNMTVALLLMILLACTAPALSALYQSPALAPVLRMASLIFPLTALGQQFRVLAEKELCFAALASNEIAAALVGLGAAITVALLDGGVYALVAATLANGTTSSLLAWWRLSRGYRPSWHLRFSEAKPYLRFGGYLVGENLAGTAHRQADIFMGGLVLGPAAMGIFSLPRDLSLRVAMVINPIITRIGFPVMARVKSDRMRLRSIYLQTLRMTASVNFPIYVALAVFADDIVAVLYGPQWQNAGRYLRVLAVWGLIRSIANPVGSLLYAVGSARRALLWNLGLLLLLPPLYWLATYSGGLIGLAIGMVIIQVCILLPIWWLLVRPSCGVRFGEYLRPISAPLLLALAAGLAAYLASTLFQAAITRLLVGGCSGLVAYLGLSLWLNGSWTDAMRTLLKLDGMPGAPQR